MSLKVYTVHVKRSTRQGAYDPDALFVPEGFSFLAMIFQGAWAMYHKMWLVAFLMFLVSTIVQILSSVVMGSAELGYVLNVAVALLIGYEAHNLRRWWLESHDYRQSGVVMGETLEDAERRYFDDVVAEDASAPGGHGWGAES